MELVFSIISVGLGVAGLAYGVYQNRLRARLVAMMRRNAWSLYRSCYATFVHVFTFYKEKGEEIDDRRLHMADATIRELHRKCVDNVIQQYPSLTPEDIDRWRASGRIEEDFVAEEFKKELPA